MYLYMLSEHKHTHACSCPSWFNEHVFPSQPLMHLPPLSTLTWCNGASAFIRTLHSLLRCDTVLRGIFARHAYIKCSWSLLRISQLLFLEVKFWGGMPRLLISTTDSNELKENALLKGQRCDAFKEHTGKTIRMLSTHIIDHIVLLPLLHASKSMRPICHL